MKETVSTNASNLAQQKLEAQVQPVIKNLEKLSTTPQTNAHNVVSYNMSTRSSFPHNANNERHHYNRDQVAKLVQAEVRRQTRFIAPVPINRPSNSDMPSSRNRRTCNKCDKVAHIARYCRAGGLQHHFPKKSQI